MAHDNTALRKHSNLGIQLIKLKNVNFQVSYNVYVGFSGIVLIPGFEQHNDICFKNFIKLFIKPHM